MIEQVEALMQHWGEAARGGLLAGTGLSPLAVAMEYGGMVEGGSSGSAGLAACFDAAAQAVDAALGSISLLGALGQDLVALARVRYLTDPMPTVEQQMRALGIGSETAYRRRVQRLHEMVREQLRVSIGKAAA
ncbi:hypothetical protein [Pseudomonas kuykendallii]|uniref:hypothetical protein n=1 Tax=Pseudomonas kuykendallii TaxID=1007099 RepID=UPI0028D80BD7|nr:hypothetical protein [Pseudomonas kuykendallii]